MNLRSNKHVEGMLLRSKKIKPPRKSILDTIELQPGEKIKPHRNLDIIVAENCDKGCCTSEIAFDKITGEFVHSCHAIRHDPD